ncbi:MAG TPA: hypothetical protein V6C81_18420 [Planktothrix sp.]|jgi:hypothetical protein
MKQTLAVLRGKATLLLAAVVTCLFLSSTAFADGTSTWLPDFNKDTHVYVDPQLKTTNPALSQIAAISDKLVEQGKRNNLAIYIVATQAGSESLPTDGRNTTPWGRAKADDLILLWQQQADFPKKDAIVIVWVNSKKSFSDDGWSVAGWAGTRLQQDYELTTYSVDSLVQPIVRLQFNDPTRSLLQIVAAVNENIDSYAQRKADNDRQNHETGVFFKWVGIVLGSVFLIGLVITGISSMFGPDKNQKAAQDKINEWGEQLSSADKLATTLRSSYLGLIEHAENGTDNLFDGATNAAFQAAAQDFREFTSRNNAAKARLDEAEKSAHGSKGYTTALELLTTIPVKVDGPALTLKNVKMFDDFAPSVRYTPPELLTSMLELFNKSNSVLADIIAKVSQAVEEKKHLEPLALTLVTLQDELTKQGLSLETYRERLKQVAEPQLQNSAQAAISDPLAHLDAAVELRHIAEQLKSEMEEAIASKHAAE